MVAATPLADPAGNAGLPGHCCLCGRLAPTQLCRRCFATHADADGTLPDWVLALRREATRQAVAEHRAKVAGHHLWSYERLERYLGKRSVLAHGIDEAEGWETLHYDPRFGVYEAMVAVQSAIAGGPGSPPRRLHRKGASAPPVAPQVTDHVDGDALATLRRYSPSGVPLDMPAFLALLGDLFGWPPPGAIVDQRHREALIDLYERVYEA